MAGTQSSLREANRSRVVDAVKKHGGLTQVELTGATGLSPATVSVIVKELVAAEVVEVRSTVRSGRRAQLVTLAHRVGLVAGIVVGHRHLRVAVADVAHEILAEQALPLPAEHRPDTSLDRAALLVVDLLERVGSELDDLLGIGLGVPAPVDPVTGMISVRGVMRGWDSVQIAQVLEKRLARPVYVDNDANVGALAESTLGVGREWRDMMYVKVSHGVGAGVVLNGRLHRGADGTAGEIGHVQVDPAGRICGCGSRGCLDTVVGLPALLEPLRTSHGNLTLRDLVRLAREEDPGCREIVADAGARVGSVVAAVATGLAPQVVVVGGELAETGETFLGPLRAELRRRTMLSQAGGPDVVPATLGLRAEITGAVALALENTDVFDRSDSRDEERAERR
ncbi:putative NBD/HSP70 family sugar kinase [Isoptericola jiangsuensis]|uniref:Putative NBD/HSP70 family sugar kinase n=2 Tax=Isoptericola jiangsuensis TaxID=548579 RepID=A0A2A9EVN6_9MICO|nr:ROK family transcriptional regulator [Isoptericola jiangsuensis]PFG42332.1 putative NBD/HSP70 family sugar kinase [Isoptericola jiangsuensis]